MKEVVRIKPTQVYSFNFFIVLVLLWILPSCAHFRGVREGLKGPVSDQVGMCSYRVKNLVGYIKMDAGGKEVNRIVIERDADGNIVRKVHYDKNGEIRKRFSYRFDGARRLMEKIKHGPDGTPVKIIRYEYTLSNRICKQVDSAGDGSLLKTHYYYFNEDGERIRKTTYTSRNTLKRTRLHLFDEGGRRIRDYSFLPDGNMAGSASYEYDESGFMECIRFYDGAFQLRGKSLIAKDAAGRPTKKNRFDREGNLKSVLEYVY